MKPLLVLVTSHHPHVARGDEVMFVGPEVERLAREDAFELCLAPLTEGGPTVSMPAGVTVDRRLARRVARGVLRDHASAPAWPGFGNEWRRAMRHGGVVGAARAWRWTARARAVHDWALHDVPADRPVLFYTYWRGGATLALLRLTRTRPRTAVVTRVHGYELYDERYTPPFQPWVSIYDEIDAVFPISAHGRDYLLGQGVGGSKIELHRLGVDGIEPANAASVDGVKRLLSCSAMLPLKRVPLIAEAAMELARRHPDERFAWTHIGDGIDMARVRARVQSPPPNLQVRLAGQQPNEAVRAHYCGAPVDAFVLLSTHEGLPVAIQEALAAGVPVIASAVGGVPEAVGSDNGELLGADPTVEEVVGALERVLFAPKAEDDARRTAARARWARDFDAERNHRAFAAALRRRIEQL